MAWPLHRCETARGISAHVTCLFSDGARLTVPNSARCGSFASFALLFVFVNLGNSFRVVWWYLFRRSCCAIFCHAIPLTAGRTAKTGYTLAAYMRFEITIGCTVLRPLPINDVIDLSPFARPKCNGRRLMGVPVNIRTAHKSEPQQCEQIYMTAGWLSLSGNLRVQCIARTKKTSTNAK